MLLTTTESWDDPCYALEMHKSTQTMPKATSSVAEAFRRPKSPRSLHLIPDRMIALYATDVRIMEQADLAWLQSANATLMWPRPRPSAEYERKSIKADGNASRRKAAIYQRFLTVLLLYYG